MKSPFPGMDPFLEAQGRWPDFHGRMITYCCDAISQTLPEPYVAQMGEDVRLVTWQTEPARVIRPDVAVIRTLGPAGPATAQGGGVATLEPVTIPFADFAEEVRETWIEIFRLPDQRLVTAIELLSPTNKASNGWKEYVDKRLRLRAQPANLVEIDLLLAGLRLPMAAPLPPGDFYAFIGRTKSRPDCEVYAWSIRQPLPKLPIPLEAPDPDVMLDLAEVFALAYARGRYARLIDYTLPLHLPLRPEDKIWAEQVARGLVSA
jgi:hypothetical protein